MSSKSPSTRQSKTPLNHLNSKKWCFPPSPLRQSLSGSGNGSPGVSPPKSPEPNCAICLGKIEDKSFTDRCFHCFCRLCLFEWAKVKAECPVCRQAFEKIIFNIRAMDDYDEQVVQTTHRHRFAAFGGGPFPFTPFVNLDGNPRFRYPTTLTPLRRRMMDFERRLQMQIHMSDYTNTFPQFMEYIENRRAREQRIPSGSRRNAALSHAILNNNSLRNSSTTPMELRSSRSSTIPANGRLTFRDEDPMVSGQSSRQWSPIGSLYHPLGLNPFELDIYPPPAGTSAHRRYVYDSELYVLTNGDGNTHRTREVSARFFSSNPACTHRLIPWLNRELNSILTNQSETETLIPRIMNALLMYDITSVGFKKIIAPFTLNKTDHFVHEFYNFARSPYDMEQYTRISVYVPKHRAEIVSSEPLTTPIGFHVEPNSPDRSSPDSLSSGSSIEILEVPSNRPKRGIASLSPTLSLNVYSIDGSESEDSTEIRQLITPSPVNTPSLPGTETISTNDVSSNPTPLPRGDLPDVNFGNIDIIDDFDNPKPGTSGLHMRSLAQTKWSDSETTDVDVGQELEDAIARFENHGRTEVKQEKKEEQKVEYNGNDSDDSCSSVLIIGYVKPLHERTPEFVDLISSEDENTKQQDKSDNKSDHKRSKRCKHRKRSNRRSRSRTSSETHSKRKCKHKSRERSRDKHRHKHKRHHKHHRSSSTSSSSSYGTSFDEMKQLNKKYWKRRDQCRGYSNSVPKSSLYDNQHNEQSVSPSSNRKARLSTPSSVWRPSGGLGSVVIPKQPIDGLLLKPKHYFVYSDSD